MQKLKTLFKPRWLVLLLFFCCAFKAALPPPPDMWAHTGAPGETTCISCHNSYPINSGGGYIRLSTTPPFINGQYVAGQTYQVIAAITQAPFINYQCSVEIVDSLGMNAGTMTITDPNYTSLQTTGTGRICLWGGQFGVDTIFHCTFSWLAPLTGEVSFYTAGVVRDNLLGGSGGYVYNDSIVNVRLGAVVTGASQMKGKPIQIYPNPVQNELHIKVENDLRPMHYVISNASGQAVKSGSTSGTIDVSDLPAGSFYMQFSNGRYKQASLSFVKQ